MTGYSNQLHKQDRAYWDVVKGIGIIAIVLGHSASRLTAFVYLWHVPLFFFITGYLYNEAKYRSDPFGYLGRRVKSTWPKFMLYAGVHVLFHNVLVRGGVYPPEELYSPSRMVTTFLLAVPYGISETTMGPLWFVPAWVTASFLFALCMRVGNLVDIILHTSRVTSELVSTACALLMGALGLWLIGAGHVFPYDLQVSLLTVPLMYAAWLCRKRLECAGRAEPVQNTKSFIRLSSPVFLAACVLVSGGILAALNVFGHFYMELRSGQIHGLLFYPVTLLGIGFCLCLAALVCRMGAGSIFRIIKRALAVLGSCSFDIMALHVLIFKLLDVAWVHVLHAGAAAGAGAGVGAGAGAAAAANADAAAAVVSAAMAQLPAYPSSFPDEIGIIYRIMGLLIPTLLCLAWRRLHK